jgi:hypothetical protein
MEWIVVVAVVMFLAILAQNSARAERRKQAFKFDKPPIHGTRKFATDNELRKAGLL